LRAITPGATFSIGSDILALIGPLPSIGWPREFTTRPDQLRAHRHFQDASGGFHRVAFGDVLVRSQHHRADGVALEVQGESGRAAGEVEHLALHHVGKAVDAADAVGHGDHGALGALLGGHLEVLDLRLDQFADFGGVDLHCGILGI
jgi:hypothetical protein